MREHVRLGVKGFIQRGLGRKAPLQSLRAYRVDDDFILIAKAMGVEGKLKEHPVRTRATARLAK